MWLSLVTAVVCVVAMFLISWPVALVTIAIVLGFYLAVLYRKPGESQHTTAIYLLCNFMIFDVIMAHP